MVISRRHRSTNKKTLSLAEVRSIPFIGGVSGNEFSDTVAGILGKSGFRNYSIGLRISSMQGRKEAVKAGSGVAVLPRFIVQKELREKSLAILQIKGVRLMDTSIVLVERFRRTTTPSVELIKRILEGTIKTH
jgi:DNA-binding transcriptional LysR family regulator